MDDLISRQAAIDAVKKNTFRLTFAEEQNYEGHVAWSAYAVYSDVIEGALLDLPSAQPEHTETHSCDYQRTGTHDSCTDCPLYDHDRHNCPRFNKVIPTAIPDAQQWWIPIKWHDCTDEEREEYGFAEEIVAVFDCEMPKDKQEILVTTSHGYVEQDVCYIDDGFSLDSGYDWIEDITAWMPKPAPYKEEQE